MPFITQGKTNWKFLLIVIILAIIVGGVILIKQYSWMLEEESQTPKIPAEKYCKKDEDCACGINKTTKDCFYGNKNYVDITQQCPDFCTGIGGSFQIKCINNECKQISTIQNETADWETCINEDYSFEIKYPKEWLKDESALFPSYMKEAVNSSPSCTFFVPKTKRTLEDVWISASTRSCKTSSCDPREETEEPYRKGIKQSTIQGQLVFMLDDAFEGERNLSYILINDKKTKQAWLTLAIHHGRQTGTEYLPDEEIGPELQIFQKILSTFRFIEADGTFFEQCIEASSFTEYFNKAGIIPYIHNNEQDWEKIEPVPIPIRVNFSAVKIYKIPIAIAGGEILTTPIMKYGNKYCEFTESNASKLFSPIQKDEIIKYLDFQAVTLAGSVYGWARDTILSKDDYLKSYCPETNIYLLNDLDKKITTVQEVEDGFLVNWIYYTGMIWRGYYEVKVNIGKDARIQVTEEVHKPFIDCGQGNVV